MNTKIKIRRLYNGLRKREKSNQWRVWGKRPKTNQEKERVMIEAILTQRVNWRNVERAIKNLQEENVNTLDAIARLGKSNRAKLERLIKPSGFYSIKARYLTGLAEFVRAKGGIKELEKTPTSNLRQDLLALKGVGEETADDILLYALGKPVFVIDEYTKRFAKRRNLADTFSYHHLQSLFESAFADLTEKERVPLFQDYHAYIVMEEKDRA